MRNHWWKHLRTWGGLAIVAVLLFVHGHAHSASETPPREVTKTVKQTVYVWWLVPWGDETPVCEIISASNTLPSHDEIYVTCGEEIYTEWATAPPCFDPSSEACSGYYLQYVRSISRKAEVTITYPPPSMVIRLEGCRVEKDTNVCPEETTLLLEATEPMPGEQILSIRGRVGDQSFSCEGDRCTVPITLHGKTSLDLLFWANSSLGDRSPQFVAQMQIVPLEPGQWRVDVLGEQWEDVAQAACAQEWGIFPPLEGIPTWLASPTRVEELSTDDPYTLLAGQLISHGLATVENCTDGGLLPNGAASPCGLAAARQAVSDWQNRFDSDILAAAEQYHVPARVLKRIFAQESQFWPGMVTIENEFGLGQLTEAGADTLLLWSPEYYQSLCPRVLSETTCRKPYPMLSSEAQAMLRGAVLAGMDINCPTCPNGIDELRIPQAIQTTAALLSASCAQTGQVVRLQSKLPPGKVMSYPDLWLATLANYNAGPGCLSDAIQAALHTGNTLTWETISAHLPASCRTAITYVNRVAHWATEGLTDTPSVPTPTPLPPPYPPPTDQNPPPEDVTPTPSAPYPTP